MTGMIHNVEVAWRISTHSQNAGANCVEAGPILNTNRIAVRDSTRRDAGTFTVGRNVWSDFTAWASTLD